MTDAAELIHHLLLFEFKLLVVWKRLPFAPTASTVMVAERGYAQWGRLHHVYCDTLHISAFLPVNPHVHHITRDA